MYPVYFCSRLVSQGYPSSGSARSSTDSDTIHHLCTTPRLTVSSPLLLELLNVVYHSIEREVCGAVQALHDVTQRATYQAYPGKRNCIVSYQKSTIFLFDVDVLLAAYAINNVVSHSPTAAVSARPSHTHISKSMITNASFRTKKLPGNVSITVNTLIFAVCYYFVKIFAKI